ncbi:MAG TPA: manganese efflux pump [Bacteroidetes bacterium]|nr:manganese efflux pump [Bacteroidota bacterium]
MHVWTLALLAVALGTDAFSVALAVGTCGVTGRRLFRLAFHFGLFQFLMPLIGWFLGDSVASLVQPAGKYLVAAFLLFVGVRMIRGAFRTEAEQVERVDRTRGWRLVGFSVATSLDALGVGVGLGLLGIGILTPAVVIGLVAGAMTVVGMLLGHRLTHAFGQRAEAVGGLVLVLLAITFLRH